MSYISRSSFVFFFIDLMTHCHFLNWLSVTHIVICDPLPCVNTPLPATEVSSLPAYFRSSLRGMQTNTPSGRDVWSSPLVSSPLSRLFLGTWSGVWGPGTGRRWGGDLAARAGLFVQQCDQSVRGRVRICTTMVSDWTAVGWLVSSEFISKSFWAN